MKFWQVIDNISLNMWSKFQENCTNINTTSSIRILLLDFMTMYKKKNLDPVDVFVYFSTQQLRFIWVFFIDLNKK